MDKSPLSVSSLDFFVRRTAFDPENLVIIFSLGLLQLKLRVLQQLMVFTVATVRSETKLKAVK